MRLVPTGWLPATGSRPPLTVLVVVLALFAAACADGATGDDTGGSAPPLAAELERWFGVR